MDFKIAGKKQTGGTDLTKKPQLDKSNNQIKDGQPKMGPEAHVPHPEKSDDPGFLNGEQQKKAQRTLGGVIQALPSFLKKKV